jgi:hypothetical protein
VLRSFGANRWALFCAVAGQTVSSLALRIQLAGKNKPKPKPEPTTTKDLESDDRAPSLSRGFL